MFISPLIEQEAIITRIDSFLAAIDALQVKVTEHKKQALQLMQAMLWYAVNMDLNVKHLTIHY